MNERHGLLHEGKSDPVLLTTGPMRWLEPLSAKDGKKIFAVGITQRGELSRLDPKSKELKPFLGGISADSVAFSQNGKSVAYVSFPEGVLWKADRDGSNAVQLTEPPLYASGPRWSPDGAQIVFQSFGADGPESVLLVPADGGVPRGILPGDRNDEEDPTWSPDGRRILFSSGAEGDPKSWNLKIVDLTAGLTTVVPDSAGKTSPRWSPDGRFISAIGADDNGLRVFDVQTQQWSALPVKGDPGFLACWSRDSQFLYFRLGQRDGQGVFRIRLHGTESERIGDLKDWHLTGAGGLWFGLDPDDAPLLLRDIGSQDIYALNLDGK